MVDARAWLGMVTDAARLVRHEIQREEMLRNAALNLSAPTASSVSTSGVYDAMAVIDTLVDSERLRTEKMTDALNTIDYARTVFSGMRCVGALECDAANVLERAHIDLLTKQRIADMQGVSLSTIKRRYSYGIDWINAHGLTRASAGTGMATD